MRFLPIAVAGLLLLAGNVSAHIGVAADSPGPLTVGEATEVAVTISALCPVVAAEYDAASNTELTLGANETPEWLEVSGDAVPFTVMDCGSDGYVTSTGNIYLTPGPLAPAGGNVPIKAIAEGEAGDTTIFITVEQYASLAGEATTSASKHEGHDVGAGMAMFGIDIPVTVQSNGALTLRFSIEGQDAPEDIELSNPVLDGSNETTVDVPVTVLVADGELVDYELVIEALNETGTALATHSIVFAADNSQVKTADPCAEADDHSDHDHGEHDENMETMQADAHDDCDEELNEDSPGLPLLALIAGLVVVALRRRS